MKNITLSADEGLIAAARRRAEEEKSTLNEQFRLWLRAYASRERDAEVASDAIERLQSELSTGGRRFTRDEMNER